MTATKHNIPHKRVRCSDLMVRISKYLRAGYLNKV